MSNILILNIILGGGAIPKEKLSVKGISALLRKKNPSPKSNYNKDVGCQAQMPFYNVPVFNTHEVGYTSPSMSTVVSSGIPSPLQSMNANNTNVVNNDSIYEFEPDCYAIAEELGLPIENVTQYSYDELKYMHYQHWCNNQLINFANPGYHSIWYPPVSKPSCNYNYNPQSYYEYSTYPSNGFHIPPQQPRFVSGVNVNHITSRNVSTQDRTSTQCPEPNKFKSSIMNESSDKITNQSASNLHSIDLNATKSNKIPNAVAISTIRNNIDAIETSVPANIKNTLTCATRCNIDSSPAPGNVNKSHEIGQVHNPSIDMIANVGPNIVTVNKKENPNTFSNETESSSQENHQQKGENYQIDESMKLITNVSKVAKTALETARNVLTNIVNPSVGVSIIFNVISIENINYLEKCVLILHLSSY